VNDEFFELKVSIGHMNLKYFSVKRTKNQDAKNQRRNTKKEEMPKKNTEK
jgi:hypothetical protein